MEKQLIIFKFPGVTSDQYDQCWEELRNAGMEHPHGLIHHVGAQSGNDWVVADVWESLEAFEKFSETLMPIVAKIGVPMVQPEISAVHFELFGVVEA